jgi:hypothetical protein
MTIETDIRTPLQTTLSTIAANVYNGIPEAMTSPSIVLVPDSPYLESTLINGSKSISWLLASSVIQAMQQL